VQHLTGLEQLSCGAEYKLLMAGGGNSYKIKIGYAIAESFGVRANKKDCKYRGFMLGKDD